jgi:alpha-tubulin suppressor-like RCC1 family protein
VTRALAVVLAIAGGILAIAGTACGNCAGDGTSSGGSAAAPSAPPARTLSVGTYFACAIDGAGAVRCWGHNKRSQTGQPPSEGSAPIRVALTTPARAVAAGGDHACAVATDGRVFCWGASYRKQLGAGATADSARPVAIAGIVDAIDVTASSETTCALRRGGHVTCWGGDDEGELGRAAGSAGCIRYSFTTEPGGTCDGTPADVPGVTDAIAISAGGPYACALRANHTVACWGLSPDLRRPASGSGGGSGSATAEERGDAHVRAVPGLDRVIAIGTGATGACALRDDGRVLCWGHVWRDDPPQPEPTLVAELHDIVALAVASHACAIDRRGALWCWGQNFDGELGRDTRELSARPAVVPGVAKVSRVSVGVADTCTMDATGRIACFGSNLYGQLGTWAKDYPVVPVLGVTGATALAAGTNHACAIVAGGAVRCWGQSETNACGVGAEQVSTPVEVPGVRGAVALSLGDGASCARTDDGVWCWGGAVDAPPPARVPTFDHATAINVGRGHACAVVDGRIECIVVATREPVEVPRAVAALRGVRDLAITDWADSFERLCVVDAHRQVACWGHRLDMSGAYGTEQKSFHGVQRLRGLADVDRIVVQEITLCAQIGARVRCVGDASEDDPAAARQTLGAPLDATDVAIWSQRCIVRPDRTIGCEAMGDPGGGSPSSAEDLAPLAPAVSVAIGYEFVCARDPGGLVRCVGSAELAGDGRPLQASTKPVVISP